MMATDSHWGTSNYDMALVRQAAKNRWPIDPEIKRAAVKRLLEILNDDTLSARKHVTAARTLAQLEGQNQADEHLERKYARADQGLPEETIVLRASFDE